MNAPDQLEGYAVTLRRVGRGFWMNALSMTNSLYSHSALNQHLRIFGDTIICYKGRAPLKNRWIRRGPPQEPDATELFRCRIPPEVNDTAVPAPGTDVTGKTGTLESKGDASDKAEEVNHAPAPAPGTDVTEKTGTLESKGDASDKAEETADDIYVTNAPASKGDGTSDNRKKKRKIADTDSGCNAKMAREEEHGSPSLESQ